MVRRGTVAESVQARGKASAARQASLYFPVGGWVKSINVAAGDQVAQGALLAELEATDLDNALADTQYELEIARLQSAQSKSYFEEINKLKMAQLRVQLSEMDRQIAAEGEHPKLLALHAQRSLIDLDMQIQEAEAQKAQADVQMAEMEVKYRETLVARATGQLEKARLYASFSGLVVSIDAKPGDQIDPYQSIGTLADPTQLQIEASVPEAQIFSVALGQPASIGLDAYPKANLTGKVKQIASKATIWQGKSVYNVTIAFDRPQEVPLAIGMGADVTINTKIKEGVLLVPTAAIYSDGRHSYVDVVDGGLARKAEVQTGISSGSQTEVVSGLEAGQVIRVP